MVFKITIFLFVADPLSAGIKAVIITTVVVILILILASVWLLLRLMREKVKLFDTSICDGKVKFYYLTMLVILPWLIFLLVQSRNRGISMHWKSNKMKNLVIISWTK